MSERRADVFLDPDEDPRRGRAHPRGREGHVGRVPALPAADAGAEVRRPRRRAAGPPLRGALDDVPARARPAHGRRWNGTGSSGGWPGSTFPGSTRPRRTRTATSTAPSPTRRWSRRPGAPGARRSHGRRRTSPRRPTWARSTTIPGHGWLVAARGAGPHGRGVRAAQRPRRPPPRTDRRPDRPVARRKLIGVLGVLPAYRGVSAPAEEPPARGPGDTGSDGRVALPQLDRS